MDISGIKGTVLSKAGAAGVAAPTVAATGGSVVTKDSPIAIKPVNVAGRTLAVAGAGCTLTASKDGKGVVFACPTLKISQALKMESLGEGALMIQGSLFAAGKLANAKLVPASDVPAPLA